MKRLVELGGPTLRAASFCACGRGSAMGSGRKFAPEISMTGAWASAASGQSSRLEARVRIVGVRSSCGSGTELSTTPYFCSASRRWAGGGENGAARFTAPSTASSNRSFPLDLASLAPVELPGRGR